MGVTHEPARPGLRSSEKTSQMAGMLPGRSVMLPALVAFAGCEATAPPAMLGGMPTNDPPNAPTVAIAPATPTTGDDLTVSFLTESKDPDGDTVSYAYRWLNDNVVQEELTEATVPAAATAKGESWSVLVTPHDGENEGPNAKADAVAIGNTPPSVTVTLSPSIPKATDDLLVTATSTDADEDTVSLTYAWTKNNNTTTLVGHTIPASETARHEQWVVTVTPNDGDGDGAAVTAEVTVGNTAPVLDNVTIGPEPAMVADAITAMPGTSSDADGDGVMLGYRWTVNGATVQGQTSATLPAGMASKGQQVQVVVTPNDGTDDGAAAMSNTLTIGNTAPSIASVSINPAAGTEATTFSCDPQGFSDIDSDAEGYTYHWFVDGSSIAATSRTLTGASFDKHNVIHCEATPFDGSASGVALPSSTVTIENTTPSIMSVTITPSTPGEMDTITVMIAGWSDADGDMEGYLYEWRAGMTVVGSGTTLAGSAFNRGNNISVTVTPFDGEAQGAPMTSNTVTVRNTPPSITDVTLSPATAYTNSNISATPDGWTDPDPGDTPAYDYQWYVNGSLVPTATGPVLESSNFTRGNTVYVRVTPSDGMDSGVAATSPTTIIENSMPTFTSLVLNPTGGTVEDTFTCTPSGWTDIDGDSEAYDYVWYVNTATVSSGPSITNGLFMRGDALRCAATPNDGTTTGAARSSPTITIQNALPAIGSVTILLTEPTEADALQATITGWTDADGDPPGYRYSWRVNGVEVATSAVLSGTSFDKGDSIFLRLTPDDGIGSGVPVDSNTALAVNTAPSMTGVRIEPALAYTNSNLTAQAEGWIDPDPADSPGYDYQWYVNGSPVSGASAPLLTSANFARDNQVHVTAVPTDGTTRGALVASTTIDILNSPPTAPVVTVTPDAPGETDDLSCAVSTDSVDADGDDVAYTYSWSDGTVTQTGQILTANNTSDGDTWRCTVTPNDGTENGPSGESSVAVGAMAALLAIPDLALWLRADTLGALASGAAVGSWVDARPGSTLAAVADAGTNAPAFSPNGMNGEPCVSFDGTDDELRIRQSLLGPEVTWTDLGVNGGLTIHAVIIADGADTPNGRRLFGDHENSINTSASSATLFASRHAYSASVRVSTVPSVPFVLTAQHTNVSANAGNNISLYVNSTNVGTSSGVNSSLSHIHRLRLGTDHANDPGRNAHFQGQIAELLVYSRHLTSSELVIVDDYLQSRYAIQ